MVSTQIINENLATRRSHRQAPCERSGSDENPELVDSVPPSGEWSGEYQDMPCVANQEYKVRYDIVFKTDGTVEGSGSSSEGKFMIKGIYNLCSGIVAWRSSTSGSRTAAEFYGEVSKVRGMTQITGTFLTSFGRYCIVSLRSACERGTALPTLLTGSTTPKREGKENATSFFLKCVIEEPSMVDSETQTSPKKNALGIKQLFSETQTEAAFAAKEADRTQDVPSTSDSGTQMDAICKEQAPADMLEVTFGLDSRMQMEVASAVVNAGGMQEEFYSEMQMETVHALQEPLGTEEEPSRVESEVQMEAIERLDEAAAPHSAQMAESLKDPDWCVRFAAVEALGNLGEAAAPHAVQMTELFKDESASVRFAAVEALGNLGEAAAPHAAQMAELLKDEDVEVRTAAEKALAKLGFAVLTDSEPEEKKVGGMQQNSDGMFDHFYPPKIDPRVEAAFAVFEFSDFEDDEE